MRRSAEWLLLPLFLMPVVLAAGFCLYARQDYGAKTDPYRLEQTRLLADWFEANPEESRSLRLEFLGLWGSDGPAGNRSGRSVPVTLDGWEFEVDLGESDLDREPWFFTRDFPAGLTAEGLARPATRYEIQLGAAPASLADAVDEGTSALRELARTRNLDLLRSAPLPPATKLYLIRAYEGHDDAERLIRAVREFAELVEDVNDRPGVHGLGSARLIASGGTWPDLLLPAGRGTADQELSRTVSEFVRIAYLARTGEHDPQAPMAGTWEFRFPYGDDWWRAPFFTRWAAPVGGVALVLLFVPSALFVAIRRRRRADEARVRFINELAHDLRTPLTSLRLYSEMLAGGRVAEGDLDRYLNVMSRESTRVSGLLANLLDLSRLDRGARKLEPERIDLDEVSEGVLADFAAVYPDRADDLRVSGSDGTWVRADRTALARVLGNLLDNAGKFTTEGTPIRLSWEPRGEGRVLLSVSDEGPGIGRRERRRVFRRYARGSAAADGVPGTGMGLSLVRELVDAMDGSLSLVKTTTGAMFEILLPGGRDE